MDRDLGTDFPYGLYHPLPVLSLALILERHIPEHGRVSRFHLFRHLLPEPLPVHSPAVLTVAGAVVFHVIVRDHEASHVEENTVEGNLRQHLPQHFVHVYSLIIPVETGGDVPLPVHDLPLRRAKSPVRVFLVDIPADSGEIRPAEHPNARPMAFLHHLLQSISPQIGILRLKIQLCVVICHNPRGVQKGYRSPQLLQPGHIRLRVHILHIPFPEIGLDIPPGIMIPPICHMSCPFYF